MQPVPCLHLGTPGQWIRSRSSGRLCPQQFFVFFRLIWYGAEGIGQGRIPASLVVNLVAHCWCWYYRKYAPGDTVLEGFEHEARVAYDRSVLPREHLLKALTPMYLGRTASFVMHTQARSGQS